MGNNINFSDKHSNLGESYREGRDIRDGERDRSDRDRREIYRGDDMYDRRDTRKYSQGMYKISVFGHTLQ